ncbi:MAG: hypothetical protein ACI9EZ_001001, partial [Halobacteriales archaeon]
RVKCSDDLTGMSQKGYTSVLSDSILEGENPNWPTE